MNAAFAVAHSGFYTTNVTSFDVNYAASGIDMNRGLECYEPVPNMVASDSNITKKVYSLSNMIEYKIIHSRKHSCKEVTWDVGCLVGI